MAREFPLSSYLTDIPYPGLTGVTYDYSNSFYHCLENGELDLGIYPDGLLWGGVSKNDCPYMYDCAVTFNAGNKTISISRLRDGETQGVQYNDAQLGYMYSICSTFAQSVSHGFVYTTNWRINSGDMLNWAAFKAGLNVTNKPQLNTIFANNYICTETPVNRSCFLAYARIVRVDVWNAHQSYTDGNLWPSRFIQDVPIPDFINGTASYTDPATQTVYNNCGASNSIIVGFKIKEYGVISGFESADTITTFGSSNVNKTFLPINNLMGNYANSVHRNAGSRYGGCWIPSKYMVDNGGAEYPFVVRNTGYEMYFFYYDSDNHYIGNYGGYYANNQWVKPFPQTAVLSAMYMGDATISVADAVDMSQSNRATLHQPYTSGAKYLVATEPQTFTSPWPQPYNQLGDQLIEIWPIYETIDDLLKYIAGFGMAFMIGTAQINESTRHGIYNDNVYAPLLDEHNVYHGEFTHGAANPDNPFFSINSINDSDFEPSDDPEPVPRDENENVGDKITRPATLGAGGTLGFITQYALRAADVTELGGLLWTSIFTSDYWKNYMFSLALDTGSLDLASILNFFISLRVYPFPLVNVPSYAQFGQDMYIGTGIMPLHFANNLHTINNYCDYVPGGSARVWTSNFYGDWRDYTNTEIILYIPYCGTVQLNPGDVVGNTVSVQYAVDFATGGCIAYVDLETGDGAGYPIAALPGQMGADIPLTATAAGQVAARLAGDAMNIAGLIGRGESEFIGGSVGAFGAAATGNIGGTVNALASLAGAPADMYGGLARQAVNMLSRGAVSAPMLGGARGFASFGAPQTPYIQIRRGIYPDFGADIMGNATAGVYTVGDLSGFVSGEIKTDSLTCSDYEKSQIKQLISNGIYV